MRISGGIRKGSPLINLAKTSEPKRGPPLINVTRNNQWWPLSGFRRVENHPLFMK